MFVSIRVVMALLVTLAQSYGLAGYLCLDDVVVAKRFSKKCPWTGWTWSNSEKHKVYGLHIVVLLWCLGSVKIPVSFRLWQPRAKSGEGQKHYRMSIVSGSFPTYTVGRSRIESGTKGSTYVNLGKSIQDLSLYGQRQPLRRTVDADRDQAFLTARRHEPPHRL